jgi:hypothetical protein
MLVDLATSERCTKNGFSFRNKEIRGSLSINIANAETDDNCGARDLELDEDLDVTGTRKNKVYLKNRNVF